MLQQIRGSSYIKKAFDKSHIKNVMKSFENVIKDEVFGDFDGIVCRGTSGLLIAPLLAYEFDKKLLVSRKRNDNSHASAIIEGAADIQKFIIVDDFVSTGNTLLSILKSFKEEKESYNYYDYNRSVLYEPAFIGCYLWTPGDTGEVSCGGKINIANNQDVPDIERLIKDKVYVRFMDNRKKYAIDKYNHKTAEAA